MTSRTRFRLLAPVAGLCVLAFAHADPVPYNHVDSRLVYDGARSTDFTVATSIDPARWTVVGPSASGLSANHPTNVALSGGALVLSGHTIDLASGTPVAGCYYTGALLTTVLRYGYGYYELCARMPEVVGWTSIWSAHRGASNRLTLLSHNSAFNFTIAQNCGYVSTWNRINGYPAIRYRYSDFTFDTSSVNVSPASPRTDFHHYGLEWTPRELIWFFDGVEIHRTPYPGPHSPIGLQIGLSARSVPNGAPVDGAELKVRHLRYWMKNYDIERLESAIVAVPTDLVTNEPPSGLAFNHRVFDLAGSPPKYTTRPGDSVASKPLASGDPANPVRQYHSTGDLARWDYNGTAPAADVFVWTPSMYATSYLQADFGAPPTEHRAEYAIAGDGSTISATRSVDQIFGGQRWVWLGVHPFAPGSGYVKVKAETWSPVRAIRAAAMQFRQLDEFYDDFSGSLSGWTPSGGNWSISAGALVQTSTGAGGIAFELRTASASWADGFVRGKVKFAGANPAINVALVGRYQPNGDHYLLRLARPVSLGGSCTLDLVRKSAGVHTILASALLDSAFDPTTDFLDLHLFMRGHHLQALAAGELVLDVIDTSSSVITAAGRSGVRTYGGTAHFDHLGGGQ